MMCTTMLHGGVCYRTSTPHKMGNKMKEENKKKKKMKHTAGPLPNVVFKNENTLICVYGCLAVG